MSSTRHRPRLHLFSLLPPALLLADIWFSTMPAGAAGGSTSETFNLPLFFDGGGHALNEIDIMAFDLP